MAKAASKSQTGPHWKLSDLLANPEHDFKTLSKKLEQLVSQLERLRPNLTKRGSATLFDQAFQLKESITVISAKLHAFAFLWFAENTQGQAARAFESTVRERLTTFENRILFLDLWWQSLDPQQTNPLLRRSGSLRYYLETLTRLKPHTLSEAEEQVISVKNSTGRRAVEMLYGVLTSGLKFSLTIDGKHHSLTREELTTHVRHPSARRRQAAYQELFRVYSAQRDVIGEMYKSLVMDWKNEGMGLRHYHAPISVRNVANDIPDQAVTALLSACRKHAKLFQHYFVLKARLLKRPKFTRYDLYAPLQATTTTYSFPQAWKMVEDSYRQFSPRLAQLAKRVIQERHLDAQPRQGKMGGAFCYSVTPQQTPYVLMSFNGQARDVSTLAHELGHAVHGMLAHEHSVLTFHSSLPLAETASIFGEQLLSENFLNQERKVQARRALLVTQLDDLYATILRQAYFVEFERQAHAMVSEGATIDALASTYLQLLREQFGRNITIPEAFQWEWLGIPHIFASPFYCYAYSFGNLLVLALYQRYKNEGQSFVPKYLNLLSAGGSASPESLLTPLNVNIRSEKFWQEGFHRIADLVETLDRIMP
ncbi:MAG: M3 family oligoendopeptidase [Nitrospirales bacterium]|nr:M3 family oligoendopeptidase [Nitrospira sp.]MDR4502506.1 M3 family oligoendopeptidase [Nitrospirales bacterium]